MFCSNRDEKWSHSTIFLTAWKLGLEERREFKTLVFKLGCQEPGEQQGTECLNEIDFQILHVLMASETKHLWVGASCCSLFTSAHSLPSLSSSKVGRSLIHPIHCPSIKVQGHKTKKIIYQFLYGYVVSNHIPIPISIIKTCLIKIFAE